LRDGYKRSETRRFRDISPYPVDVDGGVTAGADVFGAVLRDLEEEVSKCGFSPDSVEYLDVFRLLMTWSLKGKAISVTFIRDILEKTGKRSENVTSCVARIKSILEKNFDKFGLAIHKCDGRTIYIDFGLLGDLRYRITEIERSIVSGRLTMDVFDKAMLDSKKFNEDFDRRLCELEKPKSADSDADWFTYRYTGRSTKVAYGGLVNQKFVVVNAGDLEDGAYEDFAASLDLGPGEVLVALDGNIRKISKINAGLMVPMSEDSGDRRSDFDLDDPNCDDDKAFAKYLRNLRGAEVEKRQKTGEFS
jgi:hypothetical protein